MAKRETQTIDASEVGSMEELFHDTTRQLMTAYTEENLVNSGSYLTKVRAVYDKTNDETAEYDAGRRVVNLAVTYFDKDDPTEKKGDGFIKTSPELRYTATGRIDNACKRYAELAKAVGLDGFNSGEVYEAAQRSLFMTKVRESYVVPGDALHDSHSEARVNNDGDAWVTLAPEDTEAREYYLGLGLEPKTMIDRIYKVRS